MNRPQGSGSTSDKYFSCVRCDLPHKREVANLIHSLYKKQEDILVLGFGQENQTEITQEDVFRLLTEFKDVPLPKARHQINLLRKSATRNSKHFMDVLEVANGMLYFARRKDKTSVLNIFHKKRGHLRSNAVDAVGVQLARENPNICRWLMVDVFFANGTPEEKARERNKKFAITRCTSSQRHY